mmetsp:Transcript_42317/g.50769  ORF Transcript_42317/g.50769 Transcript_42317/m.50769 type:complete len:204 (-) Transcript_42317:145-756(-)
MAMLLPPSEFATLSICSSLVICSTSLKVGAAMLNNPAVVSKPWRLRWAISVDFCVAREVRSRKDWYSVLNSLVAVFLLVLVFGWVGGFVGRFEVVSDHDCRRRDTCFREWFCFFRIGCFFFLSFSNFFLYLLLCVLLLLLSKLFVLESTTTFLFTRCLSLLAPAPPPPVRNFVPSFDFVGLDDWMAFAIFCLAVFLVRFPILE